MSRPDTSLQLRVIDLLQLSSGPSARAHPIADGRGRPDGKEGAIDARPICIGSASRTQLAGKVRWDDIDPHAVHGTYGEYLLSKVGRVFPDLREQALKPD